METNEVREIFNKVIAGQTDPDRVANLEIVREYFTNPDFKRALEDFVWQVNSPSQPATR